MENNFRIKPIPNVYFIINEGHLCTTGTGTDWPSKDRNIFFSYFPGKSFPIRGQLELSDYKGIINDSAVVEIIDFSTWTETDYPRIEILLSFFGLVCRLQFGIFLLF